MFVYTLLPGWRPAFKYYNQWIALAGALLCAAIMFVIRWYFALVTLAVMGALYMLVNTLKPGAGTLVKVTSTVINCKL